VRKRLSIKLTLWAGVDDAQKTMAAIRQVTMK